MRFIHMPVTEFRSFVLIEAKVHAQRNLRVPKRIGEAKIGGRVVGRIAAQNDEQIHFAAAHVGNEVL